MSKTILYLGNNLKSKNNYHNAYDTLTFNLESSGYVLINVSDKSNQLLRLFDMLFNVYKYRKEIDYVLIDTFSTLAFYFSFLNAMLARKLKISYVLILHGGNLPNRLKKSPRMSRRLFSNSFKNIAPSHYLKYEFEKSGYEVDYIPNTIDIKKYKYKKRNSISPKILYVRALAKIYNPQLLLKAFHKILEIYPDAELCMVGPDRDNIKEELEDFIVSYGMTEQVKLTGALTRKQWHKLSERYDLFINPTTIDNTPVSLIEVAALGLPIITTNVGGIPYLFDETEVTFFLSNNVTELIKKIENAISNQDKIKLQADNARRKVEQFDWKIVEQKWIETLA